jgi:hypothetical protein
MNFSPNRPEKPDDPLIRAIQETSDLHVTIQSDLRRSLKINTMLASINTACLLIIGAWVVGATIAHFVIQH